MIHSLKLATSRQDKLIQQTAISIVSPRTMNSALLKISCQAIAARLARGTARQVVVSFALRMPFSKGLNCRPVPHSLIVEQQLILPLSHMGSL